MKDELEDVNINNILDMDYMNRIKKDQSRIVIGNKEYFNVWLEVNDIKKMDTPLHPQYYGLPIIESSYVPKDIAILCDKDGKAIKIFKLKTWRTKKEKM